MDHSQTKRKRARLARVQRIRSQLHGTAQKPRLSVYKSNHHLYAQLIDDEKQITIGGVGTLSKQNQKTECNKKSKASARRIGTEIAQIAKEKNISTIIFDRGRYKFHGIIAELANAAREAGLQF